MIVWVDDGLFADASRDLDRFALLRAAAQRRHTLVISARPDDPRHLRQSPGFDAWLRALPERLRAEVRMLCERTDRVSVTAVTLGASRVCDSRFAVPFYERQPYIQPLYQVVSEVLRGEIRVPRFQRPGTEKTWTPEKRGDLLDSLYRGFPIGTILLWSTTIQMTPMSVVGGFRIANLVPGEGQRLLLDGHQRLSTLVQILGPGLIRDKVLAGIERAPARTQDAGDDEVWVFELKPPKTDTSSRERFVLLKAGQGPSPTQLPLSVVIDRTELNRWIRQERPEPLTDAQVSDADALRDRLREYSIPVAVLSADSLEDATESFKRINSSGAAMSDFNMVAALAYREGADPQALFDEHRSDRLEPIGWQDLPDRDILRICAALSGQHPAKLEVDRLAERLRKDDGLIARAFRAAAEAAAVIGETCGMLGPEALPYSWQLVTLAIWIGSGANDLTSPRVREAIRRWLWLTTYGEVFGGVNSAIYDRCLTALNELAGGGSWKALDRDMTKRVRPCIRFDFRAARSKAVALAMARHQDRGRLDGDAHRCLASGVATLGLLWSKGFRSLWWHLAIGEGEEIGRYRNALRRAVGGSADESDAELRARLALPSETPCSLEDLLAARRDRLTAEERSFVMDLGLEWADGD